LRRIEGWPKIATELRSEEASMTVRVLLMAAFALGLLTAPIAAAAQREAKVARIGWLDAGMTPTAAAPSGALRDFEERLKQLGYVPGRDVVIERRFADTYWDRLPGLAQELVRQRVDVIVTIGTATVFHAKKATSAIPIVMAGAGEPLELGLVSSLSHPGGNVTGIAHNPGPEFAGKSLELLKAASPTISRIAVLWDSAALHENPSLEGQRAAARTLGVSLLIHDIADAHTDTEFARVLADVGAEAVDAMFVYPNFIAAKHRRAILAFISANRVPAMFQDDSFVEQGALFSHYANWHNLRRRTAEYVDKILKGAKPGDLPVEQPTKFELVINLKTAKALGLTIPPALLLRADRVIE
jgi:putative ABC transport system substrate-binding protein